MKQASIPNEACCIRQRSLLRLASKPIAFFTTSWSHSYIDKQAEDGVI